MKPVAAFLAAALVLAAAPGCWTHSGSRNLRAGARAEIAADINRAVPLGRLPNAGDIARLSSTKGKTQPQVIAILGHPSRITHTPGGLEVWDYPWAGTCRLWFKNGRVIQTSYSPGV